MEDKGLGVLGTRSGGLDVRGRRGSLQAESAALPWYAGIGSSGTRKAGFSSGGGATRDVRIRQVELERRGSSRLHAGTAPPADVARGGRRAGGRFFAGATGGRNSAAAGQSRRCLSGPSAPGSSPASSGR